MTARTRWGAEAPEDARAAKRLLVDAATACFERHGVAKTSVEDIATEAHVSRATVYRYFPGGRDELVLAVGMREVSRFGGEVQRKVANQPTAVDALVEGVMLTVAAVQQRPTLALLFAPDIAGHTGVLAGGSEALHRSVVEYTKPLFEAAQQQGTVRADLDPADAAEWIIRVVMSLATSPSRRRPGDQRRFLREYFVPAFLPPERRRTHADR